MITSSVNNIINYGFDFIKNKSIESTQSILKRVAMVALATLSSLIVLYLIYDCFSKDNLNFGDFNFGDFFLPKKHPVKYNETNEESIALPTILEEEEKLVTTLTNNWLDDSEEEVKRLLSKNLFPITKISGIDFHPITVKNKQLLAVLGRALELRNVYRQTHYVFTHGQASEISIANLVMKETIRTFTPGLDQPLNIPFRLPHTITYSENANDFISKFNANSSSFNDDANHSEKMISVDAQFWNNQCLESAIDFFSKGININLYPGSVLHTGPEKTLLKIFKSIFLNYLPNHSVCNVLANKAVKIALQRKTETQVGVLYTICIPKEIVNDDKKNFAYPCHPFGKTCNCFPLTHRVTLLEEMQQDKRLFCSRGPLTQYRLLTSRLIEEKNVRAFAVHPLSKVKQQEYLNQVKDLVQELKLYSHLSDMIDQFEEDPSQMDLIDSLISTSPQLDKECIQELWYKETSPKKNASA